MKVEEEKSKYSQCDNVGICSLHGNTEGVVTLLVHLCLWRSSLQEQTYLTVGKMKTEHNEELVQHKKNKQIKRNCRWLWNNDDIQCKSKGVYTGKIHVTVLSVLTQTTCQFWSVSTLHCNVPQVATCPEGWRDIIPLTVFPLTHPVCPR